MDNDTHERTDVETYPCAECGQAFELLLETRIGVRSDGAPGPLCGQACALANGRRLLEAPSRCRCGTEVGLDQELLTRRGEVRGCEACRWSGSLPKAGCAGCGHFVGGVVGCFCGVVGCDCPASPEDLHYLSTVGGALCGADSRRTARDITTTKDRGAVGCPGCVALLELAPALAGVVS